MAYKVALAAGDGAGGVLSVLNPEGVDLIVDLLVVDLTTASTGAGTVDFGIATTSVSNDTLIDGLDVNAAMGTFDSTINAGSNGKGPRKWAAGSYLTGTKASGSAAGLAGNAYISYHVA